ncbi:MAG: RNA polymerase sigma factor [Phycisphaeraceae bacterium]|nr:RNA polymerase sigma factor [Phycisphaeraceae bacterium]
MAEILVRAAAGDEIAWRRVVDAYAPRLFALLRAQCHDDDLAEEITQSTFCTVVSKLAEYTERGRFESWLFRIAVNRLRDEMRRRKRQAAPTEEPALSALASDVHEERSRPEPPELRALDEALAKLAPADRLIIDLRHVGGMSFKQIAEYLGEPLGTLLARHHRALLKLRGSIEASRRGASE